MCSSALFISSLDVTVVNVALPSLRARLSAGPCSAAVDRGCLHAHPRGAAPARRRARGPAGDRRALFRAGLGLFGLGSLGCALSTSPGMLIAVRVVQACGAALLQPNALSTITTAIDDPRQRARAIGVWAGVFGLAAATGRSWAGC